MLKHYFLKLKAKDDPPGEEQAPVTDSLKKEDEKSSSSVSEGVSSKDLEKKTEASSPEVKSESKSVVSSQIHEQKEDAAAVNEARTETDKKEDTGQSAAQIKTQEGESEVKGVSEAKDIQDSAPSGHEEAAAKESVDDAAAGEKDVLEEQLPEIYLNGLYATKLGMSSVYNDQGQIVPVTVLRFDVWKVTQIKTKEKDGYTALQIGSGPKSKRKSNKAQIGHLKASGFHSNVTFLREIRGEIPPQKDASGEISSQKNVEKKCQIGQVLSIHSLSKGDRVHLSSFSKGRGFTGTVKRWGYGGGPSSHGSQFHRKPGSIGMCEEPARVLPGKGMPGHHGHRKVTLKHVEVVDIIPDKRVILVKGGVPGGRHSLVKLMKENV